MPWSTIYSNKATAQQQYEWQRQLPGQCTVKPQMAKAEVTDIRNILVLYTSDTVGTVSLANKKNTSDCGGQHWTISGTNLNAHHWKTLHHLS